MSYPLGQAIKLSTGTITDDTGAPVTPATCTATITLPDATTVTKTLTDFTNPSTGLLNLAYLPPQAGRYGWRIVTTVPNTAAEGVFTVDAPGSELASLVSLDYVKSHLNLSSNVDDEELQGVITAAIQMAEDRVGPITPVSVTEICDGGVRQIVLRKYPVLSVQSVTDTLRQVVYTNDSTSGAPFYLLDSGVLTLYPVGWSNSYGAGYGLSPRFPGGLGTMQVIYTAGRGPLNAKQQYAIAEFVRHLWATQQGSRNAMSSDDPPTPGYLVPYLVLQAFGTDVAPPNVA